MNLLEKKCESYGWLENAYLNCILIQFKASLKVFNLIAKCAFLLFRSDFNILTAVFFRILLSGAS